MIMVDVLLSNRSRRPHDLVNVDSNCTHYTIQTFFYLTLTIS
jgi:hypothetical protein